MTDDNKRDDDGGDDGGDDKPTKSSKRGKPSRDEQLDQLADALVPRLVDKLRGAVGGDDGGDDKGGDDKGGDDKLPPNPNPSQRGIERDAESVVRDALGRIQREQRIDATLDELTSTVQTVKAAVEKPPRRVSRLTRALWGGELD